MIIIAKEARQDLVEIATYSKDKWGTEQRNIYVKELDNRFQEIAANPYLGRKRNDLQPDIYSRFHQQHTIFYKIEGDDLYILRVLHQSRDVHKAL